jgi:putative transcriptional regulator
LGENVKGALQKCKVCYTFGMKTKIQQLRKGRGMTQDELAGRVGVSRQTIISLENEKYVASLPLAFKLSEVFGTTIEDIFIWEDEENEKE